MIDRYARPEMARIWTDQRRLEGWLAVELAALAAWAAIGVVPEAAVRAIRDNARVDVERTRQIEERTHHDLVAFTESIAEQVGAEARWFHYGLTSSDVVDTALALQLADAERVIVRSLERCRAAAYTLAVKHRRTPCVGRTHGIHAEPTTFGLKLLGWVSQLDRDRVRITDAFAAVRVAKLSGAVGAYGSIDPRVEQHVAAALGLSIEPVATQVVARDRHAALICALAVLASGLDRYATEIRHLQRTEVREAQEPFATGQKGSSAMPHKRNPIMCERISGLARIVRSHSMVALENIPLWHERDISHSSAERVILPDSTILCDYLLDRFAIVLEGLEVSTEQMRRNLDLTGGVVFSGRVLLKLVEAGLSREAAYAIVQKNALRAYDSGRPLRELIEADPDAAAAPAAVIDDAFDLEPVLDRAETAFGRVTAGAARADA